MKVQHTRTVNRFLYLEVGFAGELGPASLHDAIVEALDKAGILDEAVVTYIRARSPEMVGEAIDVWVPEAEEVPVEPVEPVETSAVESPANVG